MEWASGFAAAVAADGGRLLPVGAEFFTADPGRLEGGAPLAADDEGSDGVTVDEVEFSLFDAETGGMRIVARVAVAVGCSDSPSVFFTADGGRDVFSFVVAGLARASPSALGVAWLVLLLADGTRDDGPSPVELAVDDMSRREDDRKKREKEYRTRLRDFSACCR